MKQDWDKLTDREKQMGCAQCLIISGFFLTLIYIFGWLGLALGLMLFGALGFIAAYRSKDEPEEKP